MLVRVEAELSKWKCLLPQLSYRERALIVKTPVAQTDCIGAFTKPYGRGAEARGELLVWSAQLRASAKGGQGLIDIMSSIAAFRLHMDRCSAASQETQEEGWIG